MLSIKSIKLPSIHADFVLLCSCQVSSHSEYFTIIYVSLMSHVGGKTPISDHRGSDASTCLNNGVRDGPLEKLWGGGAGEVQKKDSCKGKLSEENSCMQSRPGKNSCIGLPHILHKSQEGRQESIHNWARFVTAVVRLSQSMDSLELDSATGVFNTKLVFQEFEH